MWRVEFILQENTDLLQKALSCGFIVAYQLCVWLKFHKLEAIDVDGKGSLSGSSVTYEQILNVDRGHICSLTFVLGRKWSDNTVWLHTGNLLNEWKGHPDIPNFVFG